MKSTNQKKYNPKEASFSYLPILALFEFKISKIKKILIQICLHFGSSYYIILLYLVERKAWPSTQGHSFANLATVLLAHAHSRKKWREEAEKRAGPPALFLCWDCVVLLYYYHLSSSRSLRGLVRTCRIFVDPTRLFAENMSALALCTRALLKELQRDDYCTVQKLCSALHAYTATCTRLFPDWAFPVQ